MISFFSFFMVIFEGKSVIWSFSAKFIPKKPPFWSERRTYSQSTPLGVCKNCPFMQLILWKVTIANVVILKKKKNCYGMFVLRKSYYTLLTRLSHLLSCLYSQTHLSLKYFSLSTHHKIIDALAICPFFFTNTKSLSFLPDTLLKSLTHTFHLISLFSLCFSLFEIGL